MSLSTVNCGVLPNLCDVGSQLHQLIDLLDRIKGTNWIQIFSNCSYELGFNFGY